jgi:NAD(P)-dependent dehydrogenase (short-subunit alcohol dehydrogenase family)
MKGIALVTGTSSGIGLHTAVQLAHAGFTVVATMRNPTSSDTLLTEAAAAGVTVDVRALDVLNQESIEQCVRGVLTEFGRIDLLVNNAGSGFLGTLEETSFDELTQVMDVNFFGVWRVTEAVFPRMRAARSGRIITNTSIGGLIGQPFNDAYCAAKFAVEGFMESLAPVAKRLGVHISLVEPGPVNTEFVATVQARRQGAAAKKGTEAYESMRTAYLAVTTEVFATLGQVPADVARVIVEAATAEEPHLRYATSAVARGIIGRKYVDPTGDSILTMTGSRLA